jgi:pyruvate/2-oxoglutarate dehydrogenase complex dihydrolipoamide acyltransferase (E2) component
VSATELRAIGLVGATEHGHGGGRGRFGQPRRQRQPSAILGIGAVRPTLARTGHEVVEIALVTVTPVRRHASSKGADAARFLAQIGELLAMPLRLAL